MSRHVMSCHVMWYSEHAANGPAPKTPTYKQNPSLRILGKGDGEGDENKVGLRTH